MFIAQWGVLVENPAVDAATQVLDEASVDSWVDRADRARGVDFDLATD